MVQPAGEVLVTAAREGARGAAGELAGLRPCTGLRAAELPAACPGGGSQGGTAAAAAAPGVCCV